MLVNGGRRANVPERNDLFPLRSGGATIARWTLARWTFLAVVVISAMVPWYTLRLVPVLTIGAAKVNVLDALVACTVLLAAPEVIRSLGIGPRQLLWVWAFVTYMLTIPLVTGLRDAQGAFFAIREARPLSFYALAITLSVQRYTSRDFRLFAAAFAGGAVAANIAVVLHFLWHLPLPGYSDARSPGQLWAGVQYLEWTVPVVGFLLALVGAITARSFRGRLVWMAACLPIVWYALASTERFMQVLIFGLAITVPTLSWMPGVRVRRSGTIAAVLVVIAGVAFGASFGPGLIRDPVRATLGRWSRALSDDSLGFREEELTGGLQRTARHPLIGEGLGALVLRDDPDHRGLPWRYVAEGYGYLMIKAGLLGLLLYLGMVATAIRAGRRHAYAGRGEGWPAAAIGVAGLVTLLALNVLYPAVDTPAGVVTFSLFYGMTTAAREGRRA